MTDATTETWVDILPTISLTDYEGPVFSPRRREHGTLVDDGTTVRWHTWSSDYATDHPDLVPDLDDPQGFAYSLRWYNLSHTLGTEDFLAWREWLMRWAAGTTTDADRIDLARAIREVTQ